MPERNLHEAAALTTARLAATLDVTRADGHEWIPTLVFYAVIHLAEALLAEKAVHPEGHAARAIALEDEWGEGASDLFDGLRDLSEQWRYSARPPTSADIQAAKDWALQLTSTMGQNWPVDGFLRVD